MQTVRINGADVDRCDVCGALLLDRGELPSISGGDADPERKLQLNAAMRRICRRCDAEDVQGFERCDRPLRARCPRCQGVMSLVV